MLTIVIVSFNSADALMKCQDALLAAQRFPVIVVDNASRDGSAERIAERYPHVQVIRLARNEGYGRAANRGLAAVATPYAFLLNPDLLMTTDIVESMLAFAQQHDASLCAPAVKEKDHLRRGAIARDWLSGAAFLFRMADFRETGFFDEQIFLYAEDTDLCRRIVDSGQRMYLNSDVYAEHLRKQSSAPNPKIDALRNWHRGWSTMYCLHKHGDLVGWWAPRRLWLAYWLKGKLGGSAQKRRSNATRAAGMQAYLQGQKAFLPNGIARGTDTL
ncbi:MAG: glycosyltransferase family 2 protein [Pseudomonadota bacterium]